MKFVGGDFMLSFERFNASQARTAMKRGKNDVGVKNFGDAYAKILADAYKGNIGTVIEFNESFTHTLDFEQGIDMLIRDEYAIILGKAKDGVVPVDVYWDPPQGLLDFLHPIPQI